MPKFKTKIQEALYCLMHNNDGVKTIKEADIARATGLEQASISSITNGQISDPRGSTLLALCRYFDVSLAYFITADKSVLKSHKIDKKVTRALREDAVNMAPILDLPQIKLWLLNGYVNIEKSIAKIPVIGLSQKAYAVHYLNYLNKICSNKDSIFVIDAEINQPLDGTIVLISTNGNMPVFYRAVHEGDQCFLHSVNRDQSILFDSSTHLIMGKVDSIISKI